jgi:Ca2+-binding EF-hand superfamily protein
MADEKFLREAFAACDTDKSGKIDLTELKAVIKLYFEYVKEAADDAKINGAADKVMKLIDTEGDGTISLDEFIKAFK